MSLKPIENKEVKFLQPDPARFVWGSGLTP